MQPFAHDVPPESDDSLLHELVSRVTEADLVHDIALWIVGGPLKILLVIVIAFVANRLVRRSIRHFVARMQDPEFREGAARWRKRARLDMLATQRIPSIRQAQRAEAIGALMRSITTATIYTIAFLIVLQTLGISVGPILASAGILGVAIGFGSQNLVRDFLSGVFMLVEDQFGVGDVIDWGEHAGVVEGISLRSTRVRDVNGVLWHIPNGEIKRVGNKSQEWSRAVLDIGVAYDTDLDLAIETLLEASLSMQDHPEVGHFITEPPEVWGVEALADSSVAIRCVFKTVPLEQWKVGRAFRKVAKEALDQAGIEIPFPQRTLWLRTDLTWPDEHPRLTVDQG